MARTVIEFNNANCSWCLNNMISHLHSQAAVKSVRYEAGTGCIEVDHDAEDIAELMSGVKADLRGWRQGDNGERVMIDLDVHPSESCPFEGTPVTGQSARHHEQSPD